MKNVLVVPRNSKEFGHHITLNQTNSLQKLLDASLDVICSFDEEGKFLTVSAAARKVWGYEPHELIGVYYIDLVSDELKEYTRKTALDIMSGIDMTNFENQYICKDGSLKPILWSARWDKEEKVMYCVAKDATEKKKAEFKAKTQERKLHRAYKLTGIAWWELDITSGIYTCSDEIFTMYGLSSAPDKYVTLKEFLSLVHPDDVRKLKYDLTHFCEDTYFNYEHGIVKPNGEIIYVIHYSELIRDEKGKPIGLHGTTKNITQRKLYQLQLEASEKRLTNILESIGDGFFALSYDFKVTYWNSRAELILGMKREAILGKSLWEVYEDATQLKFYSEYKRALHDKVIVHFEEYLPSLDIWFEVSAYPSDEGLSVFFKNINEKHKREEAIKESNERFELVSKATSDAIYDFNVMKGECLFSPSFTALFGHTQLKESLEVIWTKNIPEDDREEVLKSLNSALADNMKNQWQEEYRFLRADGKIANVLERGFIIRNKEGKALRMVGSMQDITKIKETADDLKKLSLVAKETVNVVVITDREDKIIWVNDAFTNVTEYSFEEAIGKTPGSLLQGPETSEITKAYLHKSRIQKQPFHCEIINYTKSGSKYWMEIKGQPILNEKGEVEQFFAIQTDITERKKTEERVRLSKEKYKLLFHKSSQPKWIFKADTYQIVEVNEAAIALYGYSQEEFLKLFIPDLKLKEEVAQFKNIIQNLIRENQDSYTNVVRHVKKNGEVFYVEIVSNCIELPSGRHFMVTAYDMTEKMALELMVIEEKVTAQKEIATAIINAQEKERSDVGKELHDNVSQLLATAKLYIENIAYFPEQGQHFIEKSRDILNKSINEVRFLSKQLVTPTIRDIGLKETIVELIESYIELNIFEVNLTYEVAVEIEKGLELTIYRILQEQLNNAVKYSEASKVTIEIKQTQNSICIKYKDDGKGFDLNAKKRGIGLTNIKNRAEVYKGNVYIESDLGKGCTMEITFPN